MADTAPSCLRREPEYWLNRHIALRLIQRSEAWVKGLFFNNDLSYTLATAPFPRRFMAGASWLVLHERCFVAAASSPPSVTVVCVPHRGALMRLRYSLPLLLALCAPGVHAQALQIISPEEARLAPLPPKPASRAITRGPGVKLVSPETVSGSFPFKVAFEPRGASHIDPASVKVEYLKGNGIDLTDRLKTAIRPEGIDLASVSAPPGEHAIRVSVRDDEGRQGALLVNLVVK
jgi:hypothetical protein